MVTIYLYNSKIGTFEIREEQYGRYELWIDDEKLDIYTNPELAADDVANFDTGYNEWDKFENEFIEHPKNLDDWKRVKEESPIIE